MHRITSEVGANAYLVETAEQVVLIDAAFTVQDAATINQEIAALGKPLAAMLLTHAHIDHYGAAALITGGEEVALIATARTRDEIRAMDATFERRVRALFGDAVPDTRRIPNRVVQGGDTYEVDDVRFRVHDFGPGESMGDAVWTVEIGMTTHAFIGDLVTGGIHGFFQSGHARDWQHSLHLLIDLLPSEAVVYPGHGEPGSPELLTWQRTYIDRYWAAVDALEQEMGLTDEERAMELVAAMKAEYPELTGDFLINWSHEIVAAEIELEHAKSGLTDAMLQGF